MQILAAYRALIMQAPSLCPRVYVASPGQNALRPYVLLEMPEQGGDYTHSGPVGLYDAWVKVSCCADTADAANTLGNAVVLRLQDWRGTLKGCAVQMTEHFNTAASFDKDARLFVHLSEYTAFHTRSS
jgi:hypothetical protein